jgi:long-chain acyl-CoA synthetase
MVLKNFNQVFLNNFSQYKNDPALMFKSAGHYNTISYGEFGDICLRVASGLMKRGLNAGDRIAIFSQNRPEWAEADTGALLAGSINSAIYASSLSDEAAFIIQNLEASFLFVEDNAQLQKILAIRANIPSVKGVFVFSEPFSASDPSWVFPFSVLVQEEPSSEAVARIHELAENIRGEDAMCIIYTSGTTGSPKGVVLTHNNYIKTIEIVIEYLQDTSKLKRNISFLPLAHAFERFAGYYMLLYMGSCIAYAESLDKLIDNFREVKPNFFVAVPRVFEKIHARITQGVRSVSPIRKAIFFWALDIGKKAGRYKMLSHPLPRFLKICHRLADALLFKKVKGAFGGQLKFCCSGGAPLSKEVAEFFYAMDILILEAWGATEATAPSTGNSPYDYRFGTVGRPLPGVEVRVASDGELEAKGPNIFKGYWRNPEETKAAFTPDGFYRTGDIGEINEEGRIFITDRKKQIIITSSGKNIAPSHIENLLLGGRHIEMAYVHGDRRNYLTALLVLDQNAVKATAEYDRIKDLPWQESIHHPLILEKVQKEVEVANEQLPRYMQIKYYSILPAPFSIEGGEMTPTMKLKKMVIEEKYKDLLDGMYKEGEV